MTHQANHPPKDGISFLAIEEKEVEFEDGRRVVVAPFHVSRQCVTVGLLGTFCAETSYKSLAERAGRGWYLQNELVEHLEIEERQNATAFCISYRDAKRFCEWSHTRLPTEAEWLAMSLFDSVIYEYAHPERCPWVDPQRRFKSMPSEIEFSCGWDLTETHASSSDVTRKLVQKNGSRCVDQVQVPHDHVIVRSGPCYFRWDNWRNEPERDFRRESECELMTTFRVCLKT